MNRSTINELIKKEGLAALIYLSASLFLAEKLSPGVGTGSHAPLVGQAAAPWIFGPVQVLLFYVPTWLAALFFPAVIIGVLIFLPKINNYWGEKAARSTFAILISLICGLLLWFMFKEHGT